VATDGVPLSLSLSLSLSLARARARDYYFNDGLIWRGARKARRAIPKSSAISYGASITAGPNIYSRYTLLPGAAFPPPPPPRAPVEALHCADVRPVARYCRGSHNPLVARLRERVRVHVRLSSAIYSRAARAAAIIYDEGCAPPRAADKADNESSSGIFFFSSPLARTAPAHPLERSGERCE